MLYSRVRYVCRSICGCSLPIPACSPIRLILAYMLRYIIRPPCSLTSSGDFAIAFSTAHHITRNSATHDTVTVLRDTQLTVLFQAVVEATEEAIVNALCVAEPMTGRDDRHMPALPHGDLVRVMQRYGRVK